MDIKTCLDIVDFVDRLPIELRFRIFELALLAKNPVLFRHPATLEKGGDIYTFVEFYPEERRGLANALYFLLRSHLFPAAHRLEAEMLMLRNNTLKLTSAVAAQHLVSIMKNFRSLGRNAYIGALLTSVTIPDDPGEDEDDLFSRRYCTTFRTLCTLNPLLELERLESLHIVLNEQWEWFQHTLAICRCGVEDPYPGVKILAPAMRRLQDKIRGTFKSLRADERRDLHACGAFKVTLIIHGPETQVERRDEILVSHKYFISACYILLIFLKRDIFRDYLASS